MPKPLKAAKAASSSKANPLEAIPQLEKACTESTYNPNSLIPLLALSRHADPEVVYKAVWALHRVFIRYIHDNRVGGIVDSSSRSRGGAEEENEDGVKGEGSVKGWVRDRLFDYVEVLGGLLRDTEDALRVSQLRPPVAELIPDYCVAAAFLPPWSIVIISIERQTHPAYTILSTDPSLSLLTATFATRCQARFSWIGGKMDDQR